jgi:multicomponent Na+:H+ antiporter subunit E
MRTALIRFASALGLWVVLIGVDRVDVAVGVITAAAAAWVGLRLLPAQHTAPLRMVALPRLTLRFLWQSVVAGIDVARRALDPRLPLRPGFTTYLVGFPAGPTRNAFMAETSLLPGTVAVADENGTLLYHCLDLDQPVAEQLAAEEAVLRQALGGPQS